MTESQMLMIRRDTKRLLAQKQFSVSSFFFSTQGISAVMSICGLGCSIGLLALPSAGASQSKASSQVSINHSRLFGQAYRAGDDAALLSRDPWLSPTDRPMPEEADIASVYTLCLIDAQNRKSPPNVIRLKSYCESQRSHLNAIAGAQDPSVPYLIAPRNGQVRGPAPTVRWNPVAGVRRYQVRLVRLRDRKVMRNWETEASRITLPAGLNLLPGEAYRVVVEADNGTSSRMEACSANLHFSVLSSDESRVLAKNLEETRSERGPGLTPENLPLREAEVLFNRGLKAEAFELLKQHEQRNPSLQGQFLLGDLANSQGLNQQAQGYFRQAATLATRAGDPAAAGEASEREVQARALADQARRGDCDAIPQKAATRSEP